MTLGEFNTRLERIKSQEKKYEVKIDIPYILDKDHLDCTWYGGEVGTIKMPDGWTITIGAYGDIRLGGIVHGREIYIKDKNNSGRVYEELGSKLTDDDLHRLLESENKAEYLVFENNNWFEVDIITPSGEWFDLCGADNVLDDNLLNCFDDVSEYFEYLNWAKEEINNA